jgi:hypothetical protein
VTGARLPGRTTANRSAEALGNSAQPGGIRKPRRTTAIGAAPVKSSQPWGQKDPASVSALEALIAIFERQVECPRTGRLGRDRVHDVRAEMTRRYVTSPALRSLWPAYWPTQARIGMVEPNTPELQNRSGLVTPGWVGSTPAPLRTSRTPGIFAVSPTGSGIGRVARSGDEAATLYRFFVSVWRRSGVPCGETGVWGGTAASWSCLSHLRGTCVPAPLSTLRGFACSESNARELGRLTLDGPVHLGDYTHYVLEDS